jgi:hypothetical protein
MLWPYREGFRYLQACFPSRLILSNLRSRVEEEVLIVPAWCNWQFIWKRQREGFGAFLKQPVKLVKGVQILFVLYHSFI